MSSAYQLAAQAIADRISSQVSGLTVQRTYAWTYDSITTNGFFVFVAPGMTSGDAEMRRLDETAEFLIAVCKKVASDADSDAVLAKCESIIAALQNQAFTNFAYEGHRLAPFDIDALHTKRIHIATITAQTRRNLVL